jgi:homocysteine S-methyltransferase
LEEFHRRRFDLLAASSADLIACETIPSLEEVSVLLELLRETPGAWAWISVCCADESHLQDGSPLSDFADLCDGVDRLAAIGVNCTAPSYVEEAIIEIRARTAAPLLVYPNSGESYDAVAKTWGAEVTGADWGALASRWVAAGAQGVGGCCRVGPHAIREVRRALVA